MRNDLHRRFDARRIELFTAGPQQIGVRFRAATSGPAEILIYDAIGASMWQDGVTAKDVIAALAEAGDGPVKVRINSPGGDVFEGFAIYNALKAHPGGVETVVDGLAASAASLIALAGPCTMQDTSMFMIHNASTVSIGNRHDMEATAGILAKIDAQLAAVYATKSGKDVAAVATAMDAETYYTAEEARAFGLVDGSSEPPVKAGVPDRGVLNRRIRIAESF